MKPLAEHQTVLQVIREIVEEALLQASPALAVVTAVDNLGAVKVRLLDEEASRPLNQARNPGVRLRVNDTVLVIRTLANDLVVVCPVTSFVTQPTIGTEHLIDGSVVQTKLATNSVGQAQLRTDAVITEKIGAAAVTADKIQTGAVVAGKIAAGAVGNAQIAGGAVTADKIASGVIPTTFTPGTNSVSTAAIQNRAVTSDKIALGGVQTSNLGAQVVGTDNIAGLAVTTGKINDLAVTQEKIAAGAVGPAKLAQSYSLSNHGHAGNQGYRDIRTATMRVSGTNGGDLTLEAVLQRLYRRSYNDNNITISAI